MNNDDRIRAVKLRLCGLTWGQIGDQLGYAPNSIQSDLARCLHRPPAQCAIASPALRRFVCLRCNGSVTEFQNLIGLKSSRIRPMLRGDKPLDEPTLSRICEFTGLLRREVTARE